MTTQWMRREPALQYIGDQPMDGSSSAPPEPWPNRFYILQNAEYPGAEGTPVKKFCRTHTGCKPWTL